LHETPDALLPREILDRKTDRTVDRSELAVRHFETALQLIGSVPDLDDISDVVGSVRERFDGTGFPSRMAGEQIPLHARIIAVADAYDELRSADDLDGLDHEQAQRRIQGEAGRRYDPGVAKHVPCLEWVNRLIQTEITSEELAGVISL
jgi:response regulator RpfG family c-di-GMP phosphodiesterase